MRTFTADAAQNSRRSKLRPSTGWDGGPRPGTFLSPGAAAHAASGRGPEHNNKLCFYEVKIYGQQRKILYVRDSWVLPF